MTTAYLAFSIITTVVSIIMFIAIVKIWQYTREIAANSGAIPGVMERRAKVEARDIITIGYIYDSKRAEEISQILSGLHNDKEALQLVQELEKLKKQST